ncbi:hypothetical protein Slin15195_G016640 [Septoria linicola]|uniref:Uncharacterized protein n=1 Tax=Septoria linicola TaxID=215465 RepID=A0A9Q9EEY0_9PEZI|nr:hypothetical protein Slin14017_G016710 [Septoria linicola]USW48345.1 hypothetical protein Slin15195_G016640 [Septoria linicola]
MPTSDARFSTYSGAPSLQPSIANTHDSSSNRSSSQHYNSSRYSEQTFLMPETIPEKGRLIYGSRSDTASSLTLSSNDPKAADIKTFANCLDRMSDERLADKQRYRMSSNKSEDMGKIALGARVERALSRRMVGQDAVLKPKKSATLPIDEKRALEVEAN